MPKQLTWDDAYEIGILLSESHPELNPLEVRLPDLQHYVIELPDFRGDANGADEAKLKAIQAAWQEEFLDRTQG
jgi:FeS assembly protein IscX